MIKLRVGCLTFSRPASKASLDSENPLAFSSDKSSFIRSFLGDGGIALSVMKIKETVVR